MRKIYMNGSFKRGDKDFILYAITEGTNVELFITDMYSHILSAYKTDKLDEYSYLTSEAKELWKFIKLGITKCSIRKQSTAPVKGLGTVKRYSVEKAPNTWSIDKYDGQFSGCEANGVLGKDKIQVYLCFTQPYETAKLDYVKLTNVASYSIKNANTSNLADEFARDFEETVPVRSLAEISLEKDTTWLKDKKYYIVNDEEQAEQIFTFLENYKGIISYDTETTGLCINMFGEIGSERKAKIDAENERLKAEGKAPYKVDRLVGIIFCVEPNVSYYFPCFNRKFKNLYSDKSNDRTKKIIDRIYVRYTLGDLRDSKSSMSNYIRNTPKEEWQCDVILMERVRDILEKGWLGTHHGSFEYKVGLMYSIDSNLKDDSMLLHQLLYKFRNITASNDRGEPSSLKYLTKVEFGVDQLDLKDFFVDYSEDASGLSRQSGGSGKKKKSNIDFSYMDYEGSKAYAPADGDFTLGLILKYKNGLMTQFKNQEYLYTVEVIVSCAIGYMEYYGHRLDEAKIEATKVNTYSNMLLTEKKIRDLIDANTDEEKKAFEVLISLKNELADLESKRKTDKSEELLLKYNDVLHKLDEQNLLVRGMIDTSVNQLNLGSPAQVGELFYDRLGIPVGKDGSKSVNKRAVKPLAKAKDENMNLKYPVVKYYMDWKNDSTLLTKFFDNLPNYMYPGGFIFSGYGQITTATGRMSCSKPNAQQYPHSVTCMVIPRDGCVFADADYSQIEYRTLTAMAKETALMERFKDPDMDYHTVMASLMYDTPYANVTSQMRSEAKTFNFGIPYGMGLKKLAFQLKGSEDAAAVEEAKEKYELYFKEQPNVRRFFEDVKEGARVYNYTQTKWGRRRYYSFNDENGKLDTRKMSAALRQAGNACIQGCMCGDTRIQTKELGIVKLKDVQDQTLHVWDGEGWSRGDILYSGQKQKCIVKFSNGQSIICSPIHKFLVVSTKGNKRFVECKDLISKEHSTNPHRVVINQKYEASDYKYSSEWAYDYKSNTHNANNVFLDNIGDSFKIGVFLGRLASDGSSAKRDEGGSRVIQLIEEHEFNILPELRKCMSNLNYIEKDNKVRKNRNEKINHLVVYSKSLTREIDDLDIKHKVDDNIFMDTELLRGFLRGFFDGDGGICGKVIRLVFGKQYDFEPMCVDLQKALLFFGIRSRYHKCSDRYVIDIKTNDNQKFLDMIGFMNQEKQDKGKFLNCIKDEHIFGPCLVVESVEITDEYIDMWDVCNTDKGYYVADGIITHNTAADIFKIGAARNFLFLRENKLFGKYFITNMVHDEQLVEISCELNIKSILANLIKAMELKIDGFPPLYVGAGIGDSWDEAKGKMAEIHPLLGREFVAEVEASKEGLYADDNTRMTPEQVYEYFKQRNYKFREQKILNYVLDESNYGETLHPIIGSLLGLQFDYGVKKELKEKYPDGQEGITYTKEEKDKAEKESPLERLKRFIEAHDLDISIDNFKSATVEEPIKEEEEEEGYSDGEDEDESFDFEDELINSTFKLIDESSEYYGCSLKDLINEFGFVISKTQKVVGIAWNKLTYGSQKQIQEYLNKHICDETTPGAYRVLLLNNLGKLKPEPHEPQLYVSAVSEEQFMSKVVLDE